MSSEQGSDKQPDRGPAYFDRWYAAMDASAIRDALLLRHFELPADVGAPGVLHWDALPEITTELRVGGGGLLVDLACGRGGYGIEIARRSGADLLGIDFSAVALERARETASRRLPPGKAEFRIGSLTDTGLATGVADALMCTDSVQFAEPPLAALREIHRVLRPGGRVVLTTWQAGSPDDPRLLPRLRELDVEADLRAAGFDDVRVEDRPDWLAAERDMWEAAVTIPNDGNDLALSSLQEEGKRSLNVIDALRRVVAFATAKAVH